MLGVRGCAARQGVPFADMFSQGILFCQFFLSVFSHVCFSTFDRILCSRGQGQGQGQVAGRHNPVNLGT